MRRWIPIFVVVATASLHDASIIVRAHGGAAADVTLGGEILDLACYVAHGGRGPDHQKCALKCAEQGQPIGLLGSDGKIYVLFADHADGSAYGKARMLAGSNVEIKGEPASKGGINGLTVHDVKKL
ncbi:MAG TPA: hypothetical protein VGV60_18050 [Candidatus Polarisedimenticolia bacterium]|jgi:hypothetical protein|nr:hypothetical protein [Candidatus Polarisedimenticolia bacterium]